MAHTAVNAGTTGGSEGAAPEGHEEAMAAKFDKAQEEASKAPDPVTDTSDERPSWLPEKFNSPEDLAKAYESLEKKLGGQNKGPNTDDKAAVEKNATEAEEDAKKAVEKAGLDFDAMTNEYMESGEFSEETYKSLEAKGISKDIVDAYVNGQKALAQQQRQELLTEVGGEEGWDTLVSWAKTALSVGEIDAFNQAMDAGGATAKMTLAGLQARMVQSEGKEPTLVGGEKPSTGSVFQNSAQLKAAMADPRYRSDPAYRQEVEDRLARSGDFM